MSEQFELVAEVRSDVGKGASRRLRRLEDKVPAIIYGGGQEPQNIVLEHRTVSKALKNTAIYSHILHVVVDGKKHKVVLKALQRHPFKPVIMHMDFLRVTGNEKLHMNVPLHFANEATSPGVMDGGIVSHNMHHVEIICKPADLPEFIEVDLGTLEMHGVLHLSQLTLPKGVELVAHQHGDDPAVASIHMPRVSKADIEAETPVVEVLAEGEAAPVAESTPPVAE
ncbi:MAG: 50S ribosomal protein L25/general stress protein Ctc [Legionellales bacterium]|nr:50S ribosomal protein L25/general stress protein Ctc [Legionellales bacterium]